MQRTHTQVALFKKPEGAGGGVGEWQSTWVLGPPCAAGHTLFSKKNVIANANVTADDKDLVK